MKKATGRERTPWPQPLLSPLQMARMRIQQLAADRETQPIVLLDAGKLTPEEEQENERRARLYEQKCLAIIKECGAVEECLAQALEKRDRLVRELDALDREIAGLRAIA